MKIRKNIAISETGFLFNPLTGDSFSTNSVGLDVIQQLKAGKSEQEITTFIIEKYAIDASEFEKDLEDFRLQLRDSQVLESA
jgi:hypothetical protein